MNRRDSKGFFMKSYKIDPLKVYGIEYPALCTPKIQGWPCRTIEGGTPQYNTDKMVNNDRVCQVLEAYGVAGLDGVLAFHPRDKTIFSYTVFDKWDEDGCYSKRMKALNATPLPRPPEIEILQPALVTDSEGFLKYVKECYGNGYYSVMAKPDGYDYTGIPMPIPLYEYKHKQTRTARIDTFGPDGDWLQCTDVDNATQFLLERGWSDKERINLHSNRQIYLGSLIGYECHLLGDKIDYSTAKYVGII
jgi:hypothetical protein